MKTKFICVSPISGNAKINFELDMKNLHSCRVKDENDKFYYLESLNKMYYFYVKKEKDIHWEIVK